MRNRIKKWLLCAGITLLAASCITDEHLVTEPTGEPGTVRFTLAVPGMSNPKPSSRSLTENQEKNINSVDVLAFYNSGTDKDKMAYHKVASFVAGTTFEVELPMGNYDIMVIGNAAAQFSGAGLAPRTTTKSTAITALTLTQPGKWNTTTIPVWGYSDGVTVSDSSPTSALTIDMHRMMARVDVKISKMAASGTENGAGNANFELTDVFLANYNTVGQIIPNYTDDEYWNPVGGVVNDGKGIATAPSVPSSAGKQTGMAASTPWGPAQWYNASDDVTASAAERVIYTFEAKNGTSTSHSTNPCIVIGGKYSASENPTYYRVDFITKGGTDEAPTYTYLDLLRNHRYEITINKVTGAGYDTPKEAFDARSFNMEADVMEWEETDMVESGFDGQYTLAISQNEYEFEAGASSQPLTIRTDYPGGWKATVHNEAGVELSGTAKWVTAPSPGTVGVNTINVSAQNYTSYTANRTAYIHITAGRITLKVKVMQEKADGKTFAAPGVVGIKKSDYDKLMSGELRLGDNDKYSLTLRGSSTYAASVVSAAYSYIENTIATEFGDLEGEPVYTVLFKWGSMVAMIGGYNDEWSVDDVVWVNKDYDLTAYPISPVSDDGRGTAQLYPYTGYGGFSAADFTARNTAYAIIANKPKGEGDICEELDDTYRIPSGNNGMFGTADSDWTHINTINIGGGSFLSVVNSDRTIFLPATNSRGATGGTLPSYMSDGAYWSSSTTARNEHRYHMSFSHTNIDASVNNNRSTAGKAVRCVRK